MGKKGFSLYIVLCYLLSFNSGMQLSGQQYTLLDMRTEFQINNATMALIASVQLVVTVIMSLIFSQVLDKIENKKLVLCGGCISISGILLNGFSVNPLMVIIALIISSVGSSLLLAVPFPAFSQLDPDHITKHVNIQQGALSFGAVLSPLLMALLIGRLGLNWRWNYRILAGLLGIIIVLFAFTKTKIIKKGQARDQGGLQAGAITIKKSLIFTPAFLLISVTLGLYMFMEMGVLNYSKEYFTLGLNDALGASLCISLVRASMTVTRLIGSRLVKNRIFMCVGSLALSGVALLLLALFRIRGISLIWCALFGLFAGPCWPTVFSIGLDLDLKASGKLTSIMMILNSLGMNLGNIAIGAAADTFGVQNAYYFSAAVAIPGILVFLLAVRYFRKMGRTPEGKAWEEWKAARPARNSQKAVA